MVKAQPELAGESGLELPRAVTTVRLPDWNHAATPLCGTSERAARRVEKVFMMGRDNVRETTSGCYEISDGT